MRQRSFRRRFKPCLPGHDTPVNERLRRGGHCRCEVSLKRSMPTPGLNGEKSKPLSKAVAPSDRLGPCRVGVARHGEETAMAQSSGMIDRIGAMQDFKLYKEL